MAGILLPLLPKRVYDFSNLAVGATQQLMIMERIDVSQYIDCVVAACVYSTSSGGSNTISLDVYGDGFTDEDPGLRFLTAAPLFSSLPLTSAAFLKPYGGTIHGHYISALLTATHGTAGAFNVTLSADLVLRSPDQSP